MAKKKSQRRRRRSHAGSTSPAPLLTWWHALCARLLRWRLGDSHRVISEHEVGRMPMRLDIVILRRRDGELHEEVFRDLPALAAVLNEITFIEFKGPTDDLRYGDLHHLLCCVHGYLMDVHPFIRSEHVTLVVVAPHITRVFREEVASLGWTIEQTEPRVYRIHNPTFTTWLIQTDVVPETPADAEAAETSYTAETPEAIEIDEPIFTLLSRNFLQDPWRIVEEFRRTGREDLVYYVMQQIQQFQRQGRAFQQRYQGVEIMNQVVEELRASVLRSIPVEERLRDVPIEERLRDVSVEERLRDVPVDEIIRALTQEQLNAIIERAQPQTRTRAKKKKKGKSS